MNPYFIFKNPIIKIVCVALVLYFALLKDKDNPASLGNRLSVDKIKYGIKQANQKSSTIISGIALAKQQEGNLKGGILNNVVTDNQNEAKIKPLTGDHIITTDLEIGEGDVVACGSEAEISYKITAKNDNQELQSILKEKILIGGNYDLLLESQIIGMKKGGLRKIEVFKSFKTEDQKLAKLLERGSDLIYQIYLINILPAHKIDNNNVKCN